MFVPDSRRQPIGWSEFPEQAPATQEPFVWGAGGAQLSPAQLQQQQAIAQAQMQPDFSPVEGGVLGALARGAGNIYGAVQSKGLQKQEASAAAEAQARITAALGKDADLAPLFTSGDRVAASLASDVFGIRNPKPTSTQPILRDDNAGNTWQMDPTTGQWKLSRVDNVPKMYIQGEQAIEITNPYAQGGGGPASTGPAAASNPQPGTVEDGYRFIGGNPADPKAWEPVGGGVGNVTSSFPASIPSGNPLEPYRR